MAAAAPNPSNLLMLAAIGIGAYYLFAKRQAVAAVPGQQQQPTGTNSPAAYLQWAANDAGLWSNISKIIGTTTPAQSQAYWAANAAAAQQAAANTPAYGSYAGDPYGGDYSPMNPAPGYAIDEWMFGSGTGGD